MTLQELDETSYWLDLLMEAEIILANKLKSLRKETDALMVIFTSIAKRVKEKNKG